MRERTSTTKREDTTEGVESNTNQYKKSEHKEKKGKLTRGKQETSGEGEKGRKATYQQGGETP